MMNMTQTEFEQIVSTFCLYESDHVASVGVVKKASNEGYAQQGCELTFINPALPYLFNDDRAGRRESVRESVNSAHLCWLPGNLNGRGSSGIFSMFSPGAPTGLLPYKFVQFDNLPAPDLEEALTWRGTPQALMPHLFPIG